MSVPLYLIPKNFNPENPIPNDPFYSPPAVYSQGPWFPFIVGTGFTFNYQTSTISATGGGGGSPATPTVLGSVLGCTVANWTALGCNSLLANTGTGNTAIGVDALCSNTTGANQTAVGFQALSSNVISTCSVAVGWCALPVATERNLAVGAHAGRCVTTGGCNTLIGHRAGEDITTGCFNLALGYRNLTNLTTGICNVAVGGAFAGTCLTTESNNILLGGHDGSTLIGCNSHVAISDGNEFSGTNVKVIWNDAAAMDPGGRGVYGNAGDVLTSCGSTGAPAWAPPGGGGANATPTTFGSVLGCTTNGDTALGCDALLNSAGSLNTAIGSGAMQSTTSGSYNTALGNTSLTTLTTGSQNIGIGYVSGSAITVENGNAIFGSIPGEAGCNSHTYLGNGDGAVLGLRINEFGAWSPYNSGAGLNTAVYGTAGQALVSQGPTAAPIWAAPTAAAATPTALGTVFGCTVDESAAIGCNALLNNTDSNRNVAIGRDSQCLNATGLFNTSVGYRALRRADVGNRNTAVGFCTAPAITTGLCNTVVGSQALLALTTGSKNSVFGVSSGSALTTGSCNAIFGSWAGDSIATLCGYAAISDGQGGALGLKVIWDCGGAMDPGGLGVYGNVGDVLTSQGANTPPVWTTGATGTFTSQDSKTITVTNGLITSIV